MLTTRKTDGIPEPEGEKKPVAESLNRALDTVLAASTKSGSEVAAALQDPDSARLVQALKEDREGVNGTRVNMVPIPVGDEDGFRVWMTKYTTIFTDPNDMEDEETLRRFWSQNTAILSLVTAEAPNNEGRKIRRSIGVTLTMRNGSAPTAAYIPYSGIDAPFRGIGIYSRALRQNEAALKEQGVNTVLIDCEDAARLGRFKEFYPGMTDEEISFRCRNRLHFWMINGFEFVADPDVPYCRPSSNDNQQIQAYDVLGFKTMTDANDGLFITDEHGVRTHITKDGYRKLFLELQAIDQRHPLDEKSLRQAFPAIDDFLTRLDRSPKTTFALYRDTLAKKGGRNRAVIPTREAGKSSASTGSKEGSPAQTVMDV